LNAVHDRSLIVHGADTTIAVLSTAVGERELYPINTARMTTGRKYAKRTKETTDQRVIDARTRTVLNSILLEPRGRSLDAYLLPVRGIK